MNSISILIITHDREELLSKCLNSLGPLKALQLILVANGKVLSEKIIEEAKSVAESFELVSADHQLSPGAARNLGIARAIGEWIFFIDDDAYLKNGYAPLLKSLLEKNQFDVIGGPDTPAENMPPMGQALAITLGSPFCTGTTFRRHLGQGKKSSVGTEETLTSCNLWIRRQFLGIYRFPEDYFRTEESVLLAQLAQAGAKMLRHPELRVAHYRRTNLSQLFKPGFNSGFFRSRMLSEQPSSRKIYFWLPAIFVLLHLVILFSPILFLSMARLYAGIIFMWSLNLATRNRKGYLFIRIALLHYYVVFSFGLGFLAHRLGFKSIK